MINSSKIGLLSYHDDILKYVEENNIAYCLVYASLDSRDEYIRRMKNRGNDDNFIKAMTDSDIWNDFYKKDVMDNKATYKIELKPNEYLFDIRDYFLEE